MVASHYACAGEAIEDVRRGREVQAGDAHFVAEPEVACGARAPIKNARLHRAFFGDGSLVATAAWLAR
jgi:hypothetical protein